MAKPNVISKTELLEVAKKCIVENGIQQLTFRKLAEMAHVSQGTIYYHFSSKENLILEIVEDACHSSWQTLKERGKPDTFIKDALSSAKERQTDSKLYHQLFLSLIVMSFHNEEYKARINNLLKDENNHLTTILEKIIPTKEFYGIPINTWGILLNAIIDGLAIQSTMIEDFPTEEVFKDLEKLFTTLFQSQKG